MEEPIVIRGQVRARLLGIPLLSLTVRIIADGQEQRVLLIPPAGQRFHQAIGEPGTGVARARRLVRQNSRELAWGCGTPDT